MWEVNVTDSGSIVLAYSTRWCHKEIRMPLLWYFHLRIDTNTGVPMVRTHGANWVNPYEVSFRYSLIDYSLNYDSRTEYVYDLYRDKAGSSPVIMRGKSFMVTFVGADPECYIQANIQTSDSWWAEEYGNGSDARRKCAAQHASALSLIEFGCTGKKGTVNKKRDFAYKGKAIALGTTKRQIAKLNKLVGFRRYSHRRH